MVDVDTSKYDGISAPFNNHFTFTGISPLMRLHCNDADSPKFSGSSPNDDDAIFGGAV